MSSEELVDVEVVHRQEHVLLLHLSRFCSNSAQLHHKSAAVSSASVSGVSASASARGDVSSVNSVCSTPLVSTSLSQAVQAMYLKIQPRANETH